SDSCGLPGLLCVGRPLHGPRAPEFFSQHPRDTPHSIQWPPLVEARSQLGPRSVAAAAPRRTRAWRGTPSISVGVTAQTHLVWLGGFRVLPIVPIGQAKTALPRFGHAQIVLPAQRVWEMSRD